MTKANQAINELNLFHYQQPPSSSTHHRNLSSRGACVHAFTHNQTHFSFHTLPKIKLYITFIRIWSTFSQTRAHHIRIKYSRTARASLICWNARANQETLLCQKKRSKFVSKPKADRVVVVVRVLPFISASSWPSSHCACSIKIRCLGRNPIPPCTRTIYVARICAMRSYMYGAAAILYYYK